MGRRREQRGQTAPELMGMLLLIALVIGAVAGGGMPERIADGVERAICIISGGQDCGKPPKAETSAEPPPRVGTAPRQVRDSECAGPDAEGDVVRGEGDDPSGDPEADAVYDNLGQVDDYFRGTFGRDSYDGSGALLEAWINFCESAGEPTGNAFWDGERMKFGEGWGQALDVTAHELTHAITEDTAGLEYQCQSGALNEAMSDIFASNVDSDDWEIGEDLPDGALRDMADPERFDQPAHVDDFVVMPNDGDPFNDYGGVHTNSGIPNHAYYLMVEAIGRSASERIVYRALTEHLDEDANFEDFHDASARAAEELYGEGSPEAEGVEESFAAVGLDGDWEAPEVEGC